MARPTPKRLPSGKWYTTFVWKGKVKRAYWKKRKCSRCARTCFQRTGNVRRTVHGRGYCSPGCQYADQSGASNVHWGGGRKNKRGKSGGPILIYRPDHPQAKKRFIYEHRLVVEEAIGRYLTTAELVHHIDLDPRNNALDNLVPLTDAQHKRAHAQIGKCVKRLLAIGVLRFNRTTLLYEVVG